MVLMAQRHCLESSSVQMGSPQLKCCSHTNDPSPYLHFAVLCAHSLLCCRVGLHRKPYKAFTHSQLAILVQGSYKALDVLMTQVDRTANVRDLLAPYISAIPDVKISFDRKCQDASAAPELLGRVGNNPHVMLVLLVFNLQRHVANACAGFLFRWSTISVPNCRRALATPIGCDGRMRMSIYSPYCR